MCASGSLASSVGAGGSGAAEVRAGGGAAAVEVGVGVDVVGALLDEMAVVLDCGCCHGRHSTPITPSSSSTAATETPISHRVTELAESLWAVSTNGFGRGRRDVGPAGCWGGGGGRCGNSQGLRSSGFGDGTGEVGAACEPVVRILGQRGSQNWVERGEFGSYVGEGRRWCVEVAADDDCGVGVREQLRPGQQVVGAWRRARIGRLARPSARP